MRQLSFMLVVIIGLMTLTPAPAMYPPAGDATVSIRAFDICNESSTGISVDVPSVVNERFGNPCPLQIIGVRNAPGVFFHPLLISYQDERPPRFSKQIQSRTIA